ncbi:hypothetical protein C8R43DRAFT_965505 [Mycena crocata]|nr:hypothetical protein C8R43DRAFT_965505 [Mycena crocata]
MPLSYSWSVDVVLVLLPSHHSPTRTDALSAGGLSAYAHPSRAPTRLWTTERSAYDGEHYVVPPQPRHDRPRVWPALPFRSASRLPAFRQPTANDPYDVTVSNAPPLEAGLGSEWRMARRRLGETQRTTETQASGCCVTAKGKRCVFGYRLLRKQLLRPNGAVSVLAINP